MADIAMLVAEEYERRIKSARKSGDEEVASASVRMATGGGSVALAAERLREINWVKKVEDVLKDLEPRSQLGVAALYSFFSA